MKHYGHRVDKVVAIYRKIGQRMHLVGLNPSGMIGAPTIVMPLLYQASAIEGVDGLIVVQKEENMGRTEHLP